MCEFKKSMKNVMYNSIFLFSNNSDNSCMTICNPYALRKLISFSFPFQLHFKSDKRSLLNTDVFVSPLCPRVSQ